MNATTFSRWTPRQIGLVLTGVLAVGVCYDLARMPVQVFDSLLVLVSAQASPSAWETFAASAGNSSHGYVRPAFWAMVKLLFDLSQGYYSLVFRGFHVLLVAAFLMLFVWALQVRDRRDLMALPLALAVFVGTHTFIGTVKEAYPINHYLEVSVLCLAALTLVQSKGGWVIEAAAALVFVVASLTLETGLLVWVVIAAGWIVGLRGVSGRGVVAVTALFLLYVVTRVALLDSGIPSLGERSAGFMTEVLDPVELQRRFSANPLPFYVHNVAASVSSVLFSQPRSGVWVIVREWTGGAVPPRTWINLIASIFTTCLIGWYIAGRIRSGLRRPATLGDRQLLVAGAVIAANAVLCFPYTKDEALTTAGAFYAIAAFVAVRELLGRLGAAEALPAPAGRRLGSLATAALAIACGVGSTMWAVRAIGVHYVLSSQAFYQRTDWAFLPLEWEENGLKPPTASGIELARLLRERAIAMPAHNPSIGSYWPERIFDANY